jgi:hypothetical protein
VDTTAWLTFAAIVVALFLGVLPIWRDQCQRARMAGNVRSQVLALLATIEARCQPWLTSGGTSFLVDADFCARTDELRALYPHLVLLRPTERTHIGVIFFTMSLIRVGTRIEKDEVQMLVNMLHEARGAMLGASKSTIRSQASAKTPESRGV